MMERNWKLGDDIHKQDNLLDGFTFQDIITALHCNEPVIDVKAVMKTVKTIMEQRLEDYEYLLNNNMVEIIERAMKGRD